MQLSDCLIETLNKDEVYWLAVATANSSLNKPPATHHYSAFQTHTPSMATLNLMFSDLKAGCCANTVEAWLLRFGAACNVKKGRELIRPTCCIVIISSLVNYHNGPLFGWVTKPLMGLTFGGSLPTKFCKFFLFTATFVSWSKAQIHVSQLPPMGLLHLLLLYSFLYCFYIVKYMY